MPRKRHTAEEIIGKLREADVLLSQGRPVLEVVKGLGATEVTYYRWRKEYGGMKVAGCPTSLRRDIPTSLGAR